MDIFYLFISFVLGLIAGIIYYGGLFYTIRYVAQKSHKTNLAIISFFVRLIVTALIFSLIAVNMGFYSLILSLVPFLIIKLIMIRLTKRNKVSVLKKSKAII